MRITIDGEAEAVVTRRVESGRFASAWARRPGSCLTAATRCLHATNPARSAS